MSYYGKGTEIEILTNLYNQLSAITGIQFVDFQRIQASGIDPTKYPGCFINSVRTDKQRLLKDIVRNSYAVGVVGWEWAEEAENLMTVLSTFIDAVKLKIMTDPTRGSKAYSTDIRSIVTDSGSRHPQGMFIMMLDILYFSSE